MALVTLPEMKAYLGIDPSDTTEDAFLTAQIDMYSEVINQFLRRKLEATDYIQTYYHDDYRPENQIITHMYPLISVTSVIRDGEGYSTSSYRINKPAGYITRDKYNDRFFNYGDKTVVTYRAGYEAANMPKAIKFIVFGLVQGDYNKKSIGVDLNFGSNIQRVSIPGTISVDMDYTLTNNEVDNEFGILLGDYKNALTPYRSDRAVLGSDRLVYLE